jgi:hypothetical protein
MEGLNEFLAAHHVPEPARRARAEPVHAAPAVEVYSFRNAPPAVPAGAEPTGPPATADGSVLAGCWSAAQPCAEAVPLAVAPSMPGPVEPSSPTTAGPASAPQRGTQAADDVIDLTGVG